MIIIKRETVLDAIHHTRIHLERADQAARVCLTVGNEAREAKISEQPWLQELLTNESEEAGQAVTTEQDKAIDAITQLIIEATGQEVTVTEAQE